MKRISLIAALLLTIFAGTTTAAPRDGAVSYDASDLRVHDGKLLVTILFRLDSLSLGTDRQLYLTPVVEDGKGNDEVLPSLLVNGRNMHYAYQRGTLRKAELREHNIGQEVRRINGRPQTVEYRASVPADSWMLSQTASIRVVTDTCGCGVRSGRDLGNPFLLCLNPAPKMRSVFITPEVTPLPVTAHEGKARVQFEVDRTELHAEPYLCRNGQRIDNRAQLRIIDDSVRYALSNPDVEIASIGVCGYASPESPYLHNEFLSTNRSRALAEYLGAKYNLPADRSTYSSVAENWGEFRQIVDTAKILTSRQRADLLALIDRPTYGPSDFDAKERELKTDPKFATLYRNIILPKWFPMLRATTFVINTRLKPMSDERLAEVMEKSPQMMSLNQMMRVARLYPEGSEKFNRAIEPALKYYPDDRTANLNGAVAAIQCGEFDKATRLLKKAGDTPEAYNARGIIATHNGDFRLAGELFRKAGELPEALKNLNLLD